jgi:flavin prenyltransferase
VRVFLGITGASGAPYAARLLHALTAADCEVGVPASTAGIEVLATELYGNPRLSRDETLTRLLEHADGGLVTVYEPNDWKAPYASGSAQVDAYVIWARAPADSPVGTGVRLHPLTARPRARRSPGTHVVT